MASTGAAIFFGVCACFYCWPARAPLMVAQERRRRKIDRYERLFREVITRGNQPLS